MRKYLVAWLLPCALLAAMSAQAETTDELQQLKEQVRLLQQRIEAMEARPNGLDSSTARAVTEDSGKGGSRNQHAATTAVGENLGNPSISVVGSFTGQRIRGSGGVRSSSFLPLSEAEFIFGARIDPHARLDLTVTAANGGMAVEEGYITADLPWRTALRAGRKFLPVGRANEVHPHALIYADRPNGLVNLFGPEIFIGNGLLLDRPFFIGESVQTLTVGLFGTENDVAFDPTGASQYAGLVRWSGIRDLSASTTLELGGNYVYGKNGIAATGNSLTQIAAGHFAIKYQGHTYAGISVEGEFLRRWKEQGGGAATAITDGGYLLADIAFNRHWHLFSRYDLSREGIAPGWQNEHAISTGLVWKLSEFQSLTLQHKYTRNALAEVAGDLGIAAGANAEAWYFRWVVAIGPHGAHPY